MCLIFVRPMAKISYFFLFLLKLDGGQLKYIKNQFSLTQIKHKVDSVLLPMRPSAVSRRQDQGNACKTLCFLDIQCFPAGRREPQKRLDSCHPGGSAGPERSCPELETTEMN